MWPSKRGGEALSQRVLLVNFVRTPPRHKDLQFYRRLNPFMDMLLPEVSQALVRESPSLCFTLLFNQMSFRRSRVHYDSGNSILLQDVEF